MGVGTVVFVGVGAVVFVGSGVGVLVGVAVFVGVGVLVTVGAPCVFVGPGVFVGGFVGTPTAVCVTKNKDENAKIYFILPIVYQLPGYKAERP